MKLVPHYNQHLYYWNPGLHLLYVADRARLDPFRTALREIVQPGMVVADIGAGSGPLARFAVEAGATKVYAIEKYAEILRFAKRINETERMDRAIELVHGDSRQIALPEHVDVIVAEIIGGVGNDEAISQIVEDARRRFLKPNGKVIPNRIDVFISPVSAPEAHAQIPTVYECDPIVEPTDARESFKAYYAIFGLPPERLLSDEQGLDSIDLMTHTKIAYEKKYLFACRANGSFSGFVVWFNATLSDTVKLDTSPKSVPTCWGQAYFAVRNQVQVQKGDTIELTFSATVPPQTDYPVYRWQGAVRRRTTRLLEFQESNEFDEAPLQSA